MIMIMIMVVTIVILPIMVMITIVMIVTIVNGSDTSAAARPIRRGAVGRLRRGPGRFGFRQEVEGTGSTNVVFCVF